MVSHMFFLAAEGTKLNPLAFDPSAMILTLLTFVVSLIVLTKMCWNPILKAAREREERIAGNIKASEKAREDAENLAATYKQKLEEARAEVAMLLEEGRREAAGLKEEIVGKARSEAEAARDRAGREIDLARDKAIAQLRAETVDLSLTIASEVLETSLDDESHKRLAAGILERL